MQPSKFGMGAIFENDHWLFARNIIPTKPSTYKDFEFLKVFSQKILHEIV